MGECICSSCKNLKSVIDESDAEGNSINEECEFGFPSENCEGCELDSCEFICDHYEGDHLEEGFIVKNCTKCHKELKLVSNKAEFGEVYCVTCYLSKP